MNDAAKSISDPGANTAGLTREIVFRPAFDKRHADPKKNYGVHGVECAFYLRGEAGTVQFIIYTHWMTPEVQAEMDARPPNPKFPHMFHEPMGADLGYHSPRPMYADQTLLTESCEQLGGRPCYYDGSSLAADDMLDVLRREGSAGVWREMEAYYARTFLDAEAA